MARHGKKKDGRILQRMAFAAVVAVSILMSFWALAGERLGNHEAYVAIAAREMVSSGNWLIPYYNGEARLEKTPLNYWLVAAAAKAAGGVNDCIVRLPNAILAALSVIAIFYFVSGRLGTRIAILSSLIWATSLGYIRYSHTGRPEMSLTVFVAIAMMSFYSAINTYSRRERIFYSLVFWISFALAMLAKGPVPLLIVVPPIIIYLAVFREWRKIKGIMPVVGLILFLLIVLPWPLMVAAKMHEIRKPSVSAQQQTAGSESTKGQGKTLAVWKKEFVDRFMGKYASGEKPGYYYLGVMFVFFLPFSAFIPAGLAAPFYPVWEKKRETMFYLWMWFTVGIVAMTLCGGKRQHYILPLMPAMAILAGIIADDMIFVNKAYSKKFAMFFWVGHLFAIFCVAAGAIICMRSELYPLQFVTVSTAVVIVAVLFNVSVLFWLNKKVVAVICLFVILCVSILMWPVLGYEQEDENYIICDFASRAAAVLGGREIVSYGRLDPAFVYYLGRNVPVIEDVNEIYERYLNDSGVITLKDNFDRLKNDERFRFRISSLDKDRGLFLKDREGE